MNANAETNALEWRDMPLDGRILIEASAGTGKTYNIGLIYLRLLLEKDLGVEQILVTTFTDAAAQELRERLRRRLIEAERCLVARVDDADATFDDTSAASQSLDAHLASLCPDLEATRSALRKIQLARADLDRAPISTIHALCQRIQREFPLESGAAFASDSLLDEKELMRECVEDFWRRRYLQGDVDEEEAQIMLPQGPEGLLRDLGALATGSDASIKSGGLEAISQQLAELASVSNIAELRRLAGDKSLFGPRKTALRTRLGAIADALESGNDVVAELTARIDKTFADAEIDAQQAPDITERLREQPLVKSLQRLRLLLEQRKTFVRGAVLAAAMADCREQIPLRARQRNVRTFSMLIDDVHTRLCGPANDDGDTLASRLFGAFPAALIDEFQDTDQRQFAIFDRIYRAADDTRRGTLVMIGDPKQAIYAFRGGDIAAYLRASQSDAKRFSLASNYRSSKALVGALNALYARTHGGFAHEAIQYQRVDAADAADAKPYAIATVPVNAPLHFHRFRGDALNAKGEPLSALGELEDLALEDCANRIAAQLSDINQTFGDRRIGPGDIAVLLSTNSQIVDLRARLVARGIPCVGSGRGSVFDADIARDLELVLYGVLHAGDDHAVRGALSTRLLGKRLADFTAWQSDAPAFERELERFAHWRGLVRSRGVLALIEAILADRGPVLLAGAEGERCLTDLRHLGELLAEEEGAHHGLDGLHAWFVRMRREGGGGDTEAGEARQLRIESDAQRVQLLTIHASKGLEFPIVYLPLAWRVSSRSGQHAPKVLRFHDAAGRLCVDVGSADFHANRGTHFREDLEERLRLLYVALTRAIHAVHVYWVDRDQRPGSDDTADQHAWNLAAIDQLLVEAQLSFGAFPGEAALDELATQLPGIAVIEAYDDDTAIFVADNTTPAPRATQEPLPASRSFQWSHSFSALARRVTSVSIDESGAADEMERATDGADAFDPQSTAIDEPADTQLLALHGWAGAGFGTAIHNVLENAASGPFWPGQRKLLEAQLVAQGLQIPEHASDDPLEALGRWIDRVRHGDLGVGFALSDLAADDVVAEFNFQFPVQRVPVARLRALCAAHGFADVVPAGLGSTVLNGMLVGSADLIFAHDGCYHVLDYKTNRLGELSRRCDYRGAALDAAIGSHHYDLQALLYTVALHRYLRQRLRDYDAARHLGESWYLFVRAVGLEPGLGVWRRQWPAALIEALDDAFAGLDAVAA